MPDRASRRIRWPSESLGLSLFLWLFGVVIVAFAAYAFISFRTASEQWRQSVSTAALRASEVIKHSTHHGMLLNRKEDVHQIIRTVARAPGVRGVRVYDKVGRIIYSADEREIGIRADLRAEACIICHEDLVPLRSVPAASRVRVYRQAGDRVLGLITPIENTAECSAAPCHAHPPGQTVLGVLDVKLSMAEADAGLATVRRQAIVAGVLLAALVGAASALFIDRMVRRPVRRLIEGTERVAQGDLETRIATGGRNEIGRLATAFDRMTSDLHEARREVTEWSGKLEQKVVEKTEELGRTQRQIVHMEKMASLGRLAATVAHELNNPLAGILNYAKLIQRTLREGDLGPEERAEIERYVSVIQGESGRSGEIVRNLLTFARRSGAEFALHDLGAVVERSTVLVRHHLEMANVKLETRLPQEPCRMVCDADQIQQALVALLVNAVEAMPGGGVLTVGVEPRGQEVDVTVRDTGVGIAPDVLPNIFEPFFSTKDGAGGVGLGLAVVYGIVQRHRGSIKVDSEVGRGTTFRIALPLHPEERDAGGRGEREAGAGMAAPRSTGS